MAQEIATYKNPESVVNTLSAVLAARSGAEPPAQLPEGRTNNEKFNALLNSCQNPRAVYNALFLVTLFTGMREGEVLGLTWDCVDFQRGTVAVNKQLQKTTAGGSVYMLVPTKNGRGRVIAPAPFVMSLLQAQRKRQTEWRLRAGPVWEDSGLVFTDEAGGHLCHHTVYQNYKRIVASIGIPSARFHDLRHSFAVASIRAGDDIKTVQGNLGHATASFTLDVYGHVTNQMKQASAARMEQYIKNVVGG